VLSRKESRAEHSFDELYVRSETGRGAEVGTGEVITGKPATAGKVPATGM
jgi:hypothetical protein